MTKSSLRNHVRQSKDGNIATFLSNADAMVELHAQKSFKRGALKVPGNLRSRGSHLSTVERELAELKQLVAALAVRSVAHDEKAADSDRAIMTVLDADTASQLLDNPPEPTETLRNLLALR